MTTTQKLVSTLLTRGAGLFVLGSVALAQNSQNLTQVQPASGGSSGSGTNHAPEIDAALAGGAIALVVGGLLILTALRRKRVARA